MGLKYFYPKYDGDVIYSCDMLRLKFHIGIHRSQEFLDFFSQCEWTLNFRIEYTRPSFKLGSYKHLLVCSRDSYVFKIGCGLNTPVRTDGMDCFIEFNPNKCDMDFIKLILEIISQFVNVVENKYFHLVRFDLAVDVPFPRSDVVLVKEGKREYHRIVGTSLTEYVGTRHAGGFTKVYDKTFESQLDYDLTRIEITCDDFDILKLPNVCIIGNSNDNFDGLNATDRVIVRLLRGLDAGEQQQSLKDMGRNKSNKLRPYIFPVELKFKFNMNCIDLVCAEIQRLMMCDKVPEDFEICKSDEIKLSYDGKTDINSLGIKMGMHQAVKEMKKRRGLTEDEVIE